MSATLGPFAACSVEVNDGGGEAGATRQEDGVGERWDLRTGRDIDRVGWPEELTGNTLVVDASSLVVELPGEVTIDVGDLGAGESRVSVLRSTVPGIDDQLVRQMRIESPRGTPTEIGALARDLADRYGLDGSRLGGSGDEASTGSEDVVPGGPSLAVGTRLRSGGDAVVAFTIVWPMDASGPTGSTEVGVADP